ncbi:hypothetical protein LINGRAHAP2_LOCUS6968 [Linum grandiflorum]
MKTGMNYKTSKTQQELSRKTDRSETCRCRLRLLSLPTADFDLKFWADCSKHEEDDYRVGSCENSRRAFGILGKYILFPIIINHPYKNHGFICEDHDSITRCLRIAIKETTIIPSWFVFS